MVEQYGIQTSPNDSPNDGTIHPIALAQLEEWRKQASEWPRYVDSANRKCTRCGRCQQSLWFMTDQQGHPYSYTPQMKEALIVAHIRRSHSDTD